MHTAKVTQLLSCSMKVVMGTPQTSEADLSQLGSDDSEGMPLGQASGQTPGHPQPGHGEASF